MPISQSLASAPVRVCLAVRPHSHIVREVIDDVGEAALQVPAHPEPGEGRAHLDVCLSFHHWIILHLPPGYTRSTLHPPSVFVFHIPMPGV